LNRTARGRNIPERDDDEEAEESEDEGGPIGHPFHFFEGLMNHMHEMERITERAPRESLSANIRPDADNEDSDEEYEDDTNIARCAACYRRDNPSHKWRRLVTLPCCGTKGREIKSSTRFCAACILKLAVTRASSSNTSEYRRFDDEPDEYPVRKFYRKNLQTNSRRFCECPRCRDILLVKIKGIKPVQSDLINCDESSECECECPGCEAERMEQDADQKDFKTAKSISISAPSFKAKIWYIGRKRGMAKLLWKVSLLHHNLLSYEALGGDDEQAVILRLAGYGIIEKVSGKNNTSVYRIDRADQTNLIKFFRNEDPCEKDKESEHKLVLEIESNLVYAAWRHFRDEYRIDRSLRLINRLFFLGLHFGGYLPSLPLSWGQELVATALIVFLFSLSAQFACILALYASVFLGVGLSVSYVLKRSHNNSCWWQAILVSYFVYRLNIFFYGNSYVSWSVLVAPRALNQALRLFGG